MNTQRPEQVKVLTVEIRVISGSEPMSKVMDFVLAAVKNVLRHLRGASALITIYDKDSGRLLGHDLAGEPSEVLQEAVDTFLDGLDGVSPAA